MSFSKAAKSFVSGLILDHDEDCSTITFGQAESYAQSPTQLLLDLATALDLVKARSACQSLVLRLDQNKFDFGANVVEVGGLSPEEAVIFSLQCSKVYERLAGLDIPTIAAVQGDCFGLGLELVLHCDIRVVAADARFGLTGINFGLVPNGSAVARLMELIGESHARMMCLTGAMISADRAFVMGFVTNVLEDTDFDAGVVVLATHLASMSETAIAEAKQMLKNAGSGSLDDVKQSSAQALARCVGNEEVAGRYGAFEAETDGATIH